MLAEQIIKSKKRVQQHGEVFTPKRIVNLMLDQEELQENLRDLSSTFLEPSAGEGAFLTEILRRKLDVARQVSETRDAYDENALIALASLYGIELLEDNVELLVMNMIMTFSTKYIRVLETDFNADPENIGAKHVIDSAKTIIRANMVQGNALTRLNDHGEPLMFSEWQMLPKKRGVRKVQRSLYTFDAIIEQGQPETSINKKPEHAEYDLFAGMFEDEIAAAVTEETPTIKYVPVRITEVYKELVEEIEN